MIKNIIFDIGNVLCEFNLDKALNTYYQGNKDISLIISSCQEAWELYDQGIYTKSDMKDRLPMITDFMDEWTNYVIPYHKNVDHIKILKTNGYHVYILSNIPYDCVDHLKEIHLFDDVDGCVYSCEEKLIKPDQKIYRCLLERYELNADECLYLDDRIKNIDACLEVGMNGLWIESIDLMVDKLEEILRCDVK